VPISLIAQHLKVREQMIVKGCCWLGCQNETLSLSVRLVVMRLASGELLALACSGHPRHALATYRQRWTIESMFANLKTKGFALEATHLTDPDKLCTLLALLTFAVALTVKTGVTMVRLHPIPVKKHGRRAWSLFDGVAVFGEPNSFAMTLPSTYAPSQIRTPEACTSPSTLPKIFTTPSPTSLPTTVMPEPIEDIFSSDSGVRAGCSGSATLTAADGPAT
jgi:hypothetical protein